MSAAGQVTIPAIAAGASARAEIVWPGLARRVYALAVEVDPDTLEDLSVDDLVEVGPAGCVTSWTWLREPRPGNPLDRPFAWALIRLDGADSALLHAVDAGSEAAMRTGMRVVPRFREERNGDIRDIACFVPES